MSYEWKLSKVERIHKHHVNGSLVKQKKAIHFNNGLFYKSIQENLTGYEVIIVE